MIREKPTGCRYATHCHAGLSRAKTTAIAVAALLCATLASSQNPEPVEIAYWTGWSGHELAVQRKLVAKFEAAHPGIRVRIMTVAGSYEKVSISFAAGNPPDLMSSMWIDDLAGYAMRGALVPLDEFLRESGRDIDREYVPGVARALRYRGQTWGMMVTVNAQFVLANRAMLESAGIDPDRPPTTLSELDDMNKRLMRTDMAGNLVQFGWRPNDLITMAHVFSGKWYDPESRTVTANHPRNVEALRYMADYGKRYNAQKLLAYENALSGTNLGYVSDIGNFAGMFGGHAAMLLSGEYCEEFITRYAPKDFRYTIFEIPAPAGGRQHAFNVGGSVFVIPRDARHPREAWEFLNFLSSPEAVKEFCAGIKNMPPLRDLLDDPEFNKSPILKFSASLLMSENAFSPPGMPVWSYYMSEIRRAQEAAFLSGRDPATLLIEVQRKVQEQLNRALRFAATP
jgi:ABC-type glycerol-3-phosphate transport system substrate-binding protein